MHEHGGHSHAVAADADARRLTTGLALIAGFMVAEVVAGILAHSLALLSDAAHMLTDAGALLLALVVLRLVRRPARGNLTYGLQRLDTLSAQASGATLLVLALIILYGGVQHLVSPPRPHGWTIVAVALAGIAVNLIATRELAHANRASLNVEGAFQHLVTDLFAFVVTAAAGVVIVATGFRRADAIAALAIAGVMLRSAFGLLRASGRVLLEIAPEGIDVEEVGRTLASHPGVTEVHDLHVWAVSSSLPALSAHVLVEEHGDCHAVRRELERVLHDRYGIVHTTLQVDHTHAGLLQIGATPTRH